MTSRRSFLALLSIISTNGCGSNNKNIPQNNHAALSENPFQLGVSSGDPCDDGFVIWSRLCLPDEYNKQDVEIWWSIEEENNELAQSGKAIAYNSLSHSIHIEVSNLKNNCWYIYKLKLGQFEIQGRARTLPGKNFNLNHIRLAYASCQRWEDGFYSAYQQMVLDSPDYVVFLGDYIYEYNCRKKGAARQHHLRKALSLQDYRDRYTLYKSDPNLQKIHAFCTWIITWDDHEVSNNYTEKNGGNYSSTRQILSAYQAYYENMPIRAGSILKWLGIRIKEVKLYRAYHFGSLLSMFVLDNRQYRDGVIIFDNNKKQLAVGEDRTMLGKDQLSWLRLSIEKSLPENRKWNFIAQQTRFTPSNYIDGKGRNYNIDTWDAFYNERQKIVDFFKSSHTENLVIIGGDIHKNWVAEIHEDLYDLKTKTIGVEFCGTSISSLPERTNNKKIKKWLSDNPHCLFINEKYRGYGMIDIYPSEIHVRLKAVENAKNPFSPVITLAEFKVKNTQEKMTIQRV
ncbi:alkaline phosphatase D family protein [Chromobacterium vaccinii]|uniref:alkaline phosphatase D family protein n=1 Tax=Chromobacterium vaccinii TaxID=1108595 RepID=UPI001E60708E|nr:alkaline phosphatase D family protein [Chromobacterium vaccinii]MCD4483024.1 alkaline phosphatase D family protein [Chromobacterium vaccinii]